MFALTFSEQFHRSLSRLAVPLQRQIWKKVLELEERAPLGKKLKGNPFWSLRQVPRHL